MAEDGLTLYCICRSPDINRFMIMCDQCEEWYHGDCINITEQESRRIKYFYCKPCRRKDPFLKIHYRKSKRHSTEDKKVKKKKKIKHDGDRERKESKTLKDEKYKAWKARSSYNDQFSEIQSRSEQEATERKRLETEVPDHSFSKEATFDDTVSLPQPHAEPESHPPIDEAGPYHNRGCGLCDNCLRRKDCMECNVCRDKLKYGCKALGGEMCWQRRCLSQLQLADSQGYPVKSDSEPLKRIEHRDAAKIRDEGSSRREYRQADASFDISHVVSQREFKSKHKQGKDHGRQCYGPECTRIARAKSKYCSDECGRRLAAKRLLHIMPSRVSDWNNTPTVANEVGREELERIRASMVQARSELQALEEKYRRLESIISRSKTFPIDEGMSEDEDADESDQSVFCVVCGHPVTLRSAIKHMDRCYVKIEAQISFGSVYPTRIEGSERLFCDVYNRQQQTYCKRLQVICPEHSKEPKVSANEVCGCPLKNDIFQGDEPTEANQFCSKSKRKCNKHFKWESMYRASVDLQRIRQWLKIDEIFEDERRIRNAMVSRAGVIPLLLHQTTAHDGACLDMRTKPYDAKRPAYRLVI